MKNEIIYRARYSMDHNFLALCHAPDAGLIITYRAYAGMANRFRAHYLAELMGQKIGRNVFPAWIETDHLRSNGFDIFNGLPRRMATLSLPSYCLLGLNHIRTGAYIEIARRNSNRLIVLSFDAQWMQFNASRSLMDANCPVKFPFREDVLSSAYSLVGELRRPYLAVHIRQTDFLSHTNHGKSPAYFEGQIAMRVNERRQDRFKTLLVASDSLVHISAETRAKFEHVVVLTPTLRRRQHGVAKQALTHLLALAAADAFVESPKSSFSEFILALRRGIILSG
jgi:hypothetical protein